MKRKSKQRGGEQYFIVVPYDLYQDGVLFPRNSTEGTMGMMIRYHGLAPDVEEHILEYIGAQPTTVTIEPRYSLVLLQYASNNSIAISDVPPFNWRQFGRTYTLRFGEPRPATQNDFRVPNVPNIEYVNTANDYEYGYFNENTNAENIFTVRQQNRPQQNRMGNLLNTVRRQRNNGLRGNIFNRAPNVGNIEINSNYENFINREGFKEGNNAIRLERRFVFRPEGIKQWYNISQTNPATRKRINEGNIEKGKIKFKRGGRRYRTYKNRK